MTRPRLRMTTDLLTPAQVAAIFRVTPRTVANWAQRGLLPATITPGGQRRFTRTHVDQLLTPHPEDPDTPPAPLTNSPRLS